MVEPHFAEEEQAEKLKAWWKQNGSSVVTGAVVGIGIIVGVNWWRGHKVEVAENASTLYEEMVQAQVQAQDDEVRALGSRLQSDFVQTPYAGKAALFLARVAYEDDEPETAIRHLQWAIDNAVEKAVRHAATLRLARIQLELEEFDAVAGLLARDGYDGFTSEYKELEGDLAMAKGQPTLAKPAYEAALEALPTGSNYADILNMKLDHAIAEGGQ